MKDYVAGSMHSFKPWLDRTKYFFREANSLTIDCPKETFSQILHDSDIEIIVRVKHKKKVKMVKFHRVCPDVITKLDEDQVFVFGSNLSGLHYGGAASAAHTYFGAEWGVGKGLTGKSYAIPTKSEGIERTLTIKEIREHVNEFLDFARKNPGKKFMVTQIGCGIAGYKAGQIAPLFYPIVKLDNVYLPKEFLFIIKKMIDDKK